MEEHENKASVASRSKSHPNSVFLQVAQYLIFDISAFAVYLSVQHTIYLFSFKMSCF